MFGLPWYRFGDRWLISRTALWWFTAAGTVHVLLPVFLARFPDDPGLLAKLIGGAIGILWPLSYLFLWYGMWRFLTRLDPSGKRTKIIWSWVLGFLFWPGAMLYFVVVYIRASSKVGPLTYKFSVRDNP